MSTTPVLGNRTKKYIKAFMQFSLFTGVMFALAMSIKIGFLHGILAGILFALALSTLMALIFIPVDYIKTRKLPAEAMKVSQERDIRCKGDLGSVYNYCVEIIKHFNGTKNIQYQDNDNIIASTKTTNASFGEKITLQLTQINRETINIHIMSQPLVKYTILDYGKNYKNVEYIIDQIGKYKVNS